MSRNQAVPILLVHSWWLPHSLFSSAVIYTAVVSFVINITPFHCLFSPISYTYLSSPCLYPFLSFPFLSSPLLSHRPPYFFPCPISCKHLPEWQRYTRSDESFYWPNFYQYVLDGGGFKLAQLPSLISLQSLKRRALCLTCWYRFRDLWQRFVYFSLAPLGPQALVSQTVVIVVINNHTKTLAHTQTHTHVTHNVLSLQLSSRRQHDWHLEVLTSGLVWKIRTFMLFMWFSRCWILKSYSHRRHIFSKKTF